ncbi:Cyclin-dependent kinases regulatory subunit [Rhizophlyctis rosea]|uniref:Cyclin-dependent kinases regulatory subunit n=1 Tax=Rhizophlyctis rosea TaxID=64517 RepID=A0AAD5SC50_9FUNG|nr:Cyclin-dependent kinases regulatory subunit [Rhizophlyctis rosea]
MDDSARAAQRDRDIQEYKKDIYYSNKYNDEVYEYRHVTLPKQIAQWLPKDTLMSEQEWRSYGVQQSPGWNHYMLHGPEPHILLFRREKDYQIKYPNGVPVQASKVGGLAG